MQYFSSQETVYRKKKIDVWESWVRKRSVLKFNQCLLNWMNIWSLHNFNCLSDLVPCSFISAKAKRCSLVVSHTQRVFRLKMKVRLEGFKSFKWTFDTQIRSLANNFNQHFLNDGSNTMHNLPTPAQQTTTYIFRCFFLTAVQNNAL